MSPCRRCAGEKTEIGLHHGALAREVAEQEGLRLVHTLDEGLPFRYTWPDFPIGHAVQLQNRGTMQGFAQIPFCFST